MVFYSGRSLIIALLFWVQNGLLYIFSINYIYISLIRWWSSFHYKRVKSDAPHLQGGGCLTSIYYFNPFANALLIWNIYSNTPLLVVSTVSESILIQS